MRPEAVAGLVSLTGMPSFLFQHLHSSPPLGRGHPSLLDAPVLEAPAGSGGWPIVCFSHGTWGSEEVYTSLCRSLASLGFLVVALEHEDGSGCYACTAEGETIQYQSPLNDGERTQAMLSQRLRELSSALTALGEHGPQVERQLDAVLSACKRSSFILMGHSFGAATCALAAQELSGMATFECALLFDTWAGALTPERRDLGVPGLPVLTVER